jgi:hypothetical protein
MPYFDLPILSDDGLVWVASLYYNDSATDQARKYGSRYHVVRDMSTSPSLVTQVGFPPGYRILKACYGGDGRIYLAMTGSYVACYKNGDKKVWQVQLDSPLAIEKKMVYKTLQLPWAGEQGGGGSSQESPGGIGELNVRELEISPWSPPKDGRQISDMIMDHYNTIYVICSYAEGTAAMRPSKLYVLNPDNGSTISVTDVDVPGEDGPINSLAIGCYGKLLLLNSAGYLNVYKEKKPMPRPGAMRSTEDKQETPEIR